MSKYTLTDKTLADVRQSRSFMLIIPDYATPDAPEGGWAAVPKDKKCKYTWDDQIRIKQVDFEEGDEVDIVKVQHEILTGPNEGRVRTEFMRLRPPADGVIDKMTEMNLSKIDEFITASGMGYEYDDHGDNDVIESIKQLTNVELRVQLTQQVRWDKKNKQFREDVEISKVYGDDE